MNKVSVKQSKGHIKYQLDENGHTVLKLNHNVESNTLRIQTEFLQRALIIEDEGLLKAKWVLKNEYGVKMGQLMYDNFNQRHGSFEIEGSRFRFIVQNDSVNELHIYKSSGKKVLYSCSFSNDVINNDSNISFTHPIIFAVSWYLFMKNVDQKDFAFSA